MHTRTHTLTKLLFFIALLIKKYVGSFGCMCVRVCSFAPDDWGRTYVYLREGQQHFFYYEIMKQIDVSEFIASIFNIHIFIHV